MDNSGEVAVWPDRLVITARRGVASGRRLLGGSMVALGLLWCGVVVSLTWWIADVFVLSEPTLALLESGLGLVTVFTDLLITLALGAGLILIGALHLLDARQLDRLRLVIDSQGMSRENGRRVTARWEHIRQVAVTSGDPRWQRLLVDVGALPAQGRSGRPIRPGRAQLQLLRGRRRFAVNVPICSLETEVADILHAVRHYSGGRFPAT